ncbi:hypothetical protein CLV84_1570 [Neolewinella xylanilytica]|uniref:Outer membrane beta-barrel porin/alpha-amylase n=1 Tax=Neolewinella xylanilytica TaxID=1514080 RepID=A0A2S6IAR8_9BACT|nr:hypothetical protein [Neolewinella xylanilytica]PPK88601.1 hypothetical protein CLV84_1570 [Neolewinella xylanilytica]
MKLLRLVLFTMLWTPTLTGQDAATDTVPFPMRHNGRSSGLQVSYGLNAYVPVFGGTTFGASLDLEGRFHRNFSFLATLGRQIETTTDVWGNMPLDTIGPPLPPAWPRERVGSDVGQHQRWTYLGGGVQTNLRIGAGDFCLGVLLTVGLDQLRQFIPYGSLVLPTVIDPPKPNTIGAPRGLSGVATVNYQPLIRLGGRLQLHYTRWFSRHLALRVGAAIDGRGTVISGTYNDRSPERSRYQVSEISYSELFRSGIENYGLPIPEFFQTSDPTSRRAAVLVNVGVIYKPSKNLPGE